MNGRVYDYNLGRFLSVDPYIQGTSSQAINPYSYIMNNPLAGTDPTGYRSMPGEPRTEALGQAMVIALGMGSESDLATLRQEPGVESLVRLAEVAVSIEAGVEEFIESGSVEAATAAVAASLKASSDSENSSSKSRKRSKNKSNGNKNTSRSSKSESKTNVGDNSKGKDSCCFIAGTLVLTQDGYKNIEDVKVGEYVWAKNTETGEEAWKAVTKVWIEENRGIYDIRLETTNGEEQKIQATDDHPFYVVGKGWKTTVELHSGDRIESNLGQPLTVKSVTDEKRQDVTYNYTVEDFHTYYVTKRNVLVHNCDKGDKPKGRGNVEHAKNFDKAREKAFKNAGMEDSSKVKFTKTDPETGTVTEFKGERGAKVAYDAPHADADASKGHDKPHVGWQQSGKQSEGGGGRGNITYDGEQHPHRQNKKDN